MDSRVGNLGMDPDSMERFLEYRPFNLYLLVLFGGRLVEVEGKEVEGEELKGVVVEVEEVVDEESEGKELKGEGVKVEIGKSIQNSLKKILYK